MTRPPKPPIVHRLERRRSGQPVSDRYRFAPPDRGGLDLMFWGCVVIAVADLYCLLIWGART